MAETTTVEQYMAEAMVYERAQSTLLSIMNNLAKQRNENERKARKNGEKNDKSFQVVIDALSATRQRFHKESNRLWKMAEKNADIHDTGVENLCNAVIQKAAEDYETALCGKGSGDKRAAIEKFAENGADVYTTIDFENVLERIRDAQPRFSRIAREHAADIISETNANRKNDGDNRKNTYKCPLCGGGMYAYGKLISGIQQMRCTGCSLFEGVVINEDFT